jgi:hypothetical protein
MTHLVLRADCETVKTMVQRPFTHLEEVNTTSQSLELASQIRMMVGDTPRGFAVAQCSLHMYTVDVTLFRPMPGETRRLYHISSNPLQDDWKA